ncbi:hypothetical protein, partial [Streptococcus agalactiae]|uniref:hypothetical protein n=1 Tax=Streptococcus agalactiae TaxID=1311 RepID=UPI001A7E8621
MNYYEIGKLYELNFEIFKIFIEKNINVIGLTYAILPVLIVEIDGKKKIWTISKQFIVTKFIT